MSTKQTRCRTCDAPINWAVTASRKNIPLDTEPVDPATVGAQVTFRRHGKLQARSYDVAVEEIAAMTGASSQHVRDQITARVFEAYASHFATCPYAGLHRIRKPR